MRDESTAIEIEGPPDFLHRVTAALALLKSGAPDHYLEICRYIKKIEQAPPPPTPMSGMAADHVSPTFFLGRKTAFHSLEWCASCIAHDAYHSKLYHEWKAARPGQEIPAEAWGGPTKELECNQYQIEVGRLIGLPEDTIRYLESLDGSHALLEQIDW